MNDADKMKILKQDLQMITSANDEYLQNLLSLSAERIRGEGIILIENDIRSDMAQIQYAAYLYRKRAAADTVMPRYLRFELNNMKFSKKYGGGTSDV